MKIIKTAIIISLVVFINNTFAQWRVIHGHTGHVELMKNIQGGVNGVVYKGQGLDITLKAGHKNYLHWAFPASTLQNFDNICLRFRTYSHDAYITYVGIWNGNQRIKRFDDLSITSPNQYTFRYFILDSCTVFNKGLGITVRINAGVESMSHRFVFPSIYARECTSRRLRRYPLSLESESESDSESLEDSINEDEFLFKEE